CRRARVYPQLRRIRHLRDRLANLARRLHARIANRAAVGIVIAAIDTAAREIDADVAACELADARPIGHAPRFRARIAAENDHGVSLSMKMAREDVPHLTAAAGNNDFHDSAAFLIAALRS